MGSKTRARELMKNAGVPIVPGTTEPVETLEDAQKIAEDIGYPIAVKAAGGGGGKGFRVAEEPEKLQEAFEGAAREGEKFFSDDTVYLERYLPDPRHVEVQVLADKEGNTIHLGERDCSIQRRHQKLIEESPAPLVDDELREKIGKIAVDAAKAVGYHSAGTIEGLLQDGEYFFLEMNTRVQVEHCVTEEVSGIDIVREQILIAAGETLSLTQDDVAPARPRDRVPHQRRGRRQELRPRPRDGHALPRAERPRRARRLRRALRLGDHAALRPDGGQADRPRHRPRGRHGADAARAQGVRDRGRHHPDPVPQGDHGLRAVGQGRDLPRPDRRPQVAQGARPAEARAKPATRTSPSPSSAPTPSRCRASASTSPSTASRCSPPPTAPRPPQARKPARSERAKSGSGGGTDELTSPLQGNMWKVLVEKGATVEEGQLICIIEAMKMENEITAHKAGTIEDLPITEGAAVKSGDLLAVIK